MVTWMPLTRELLEKYPDNLPVGVIKPGTTVLIDGPESGENHYLRKYCGKRLL